MSVRMQSALREHLASLRHEPIGTRIRGFVDDVAVVDSTRAVLVWEPRRVVCEYAVPLDDLRATLSDATEPPGAVAPADGLIFPNVPFAAHTADGRSCDVEIDGRTLPNAAFVPADPDLDGMVVLDFAAFDRWLHEDEPNIGHPRDPFHRLDFLPSSRRVSVRSGNTVVADSSRAVAVFEAQLPPRYYLPREDVRAELMPTDTSTICAYKGVASYWTVRVEGAELPDAVWSYENPLPDAPLLEGRVCFDDSVLDVTVESG